MKKRKKEKKSELEFVAVVPDSEDEEIIRELAEDGHIKVVKNGKSRHRMHFRCHQSMWDHFFKKIRDLCYVESPVPCPGGISRTILSQSKSNAKIRYNPKRKRKTPRSISGKKNKHKSVGSAKPAKAAGANSMSDLRQHNRQRI